MNIFSKIKSIIFSITSTNFTQWLLITLASWGSFFILLWPKIIYWKYPAIYVKGVITFADLAAHISYASAIAYRPWYMWFSPHPLYAGHNFNYPFLADTFPGLLMKINFEPAQAMVLSGIILCVFLIISLYCFYYYFLRSGFWSLFAITIFFTNGGLGFIFLQKLISQPLSGYFSAISFAPTYKILYINEIISHILPQRAFVLGVGLSLIPIVIISYWIKHNFIKVQYWQIFTLGFASSIICLTHIHSVFVLSVILFCYLVNYPRFRRQFIYLGLSAAMPSLIIYLILYHGQTTETFFRWYPGWLANPESNRVNWIYFWLLNWGLMLPLSLTYIWLSKLYRHPLIQATIILFVLSNLFLFQPLPSDNNKILSWVYLILCIPAVLALQKLWTKKIIGKILVLISFFILTTTGWLDLYFLTNTKYEQYHLSFLNVDIPISITEDIQIAKQLRDISKPSDTILSSDRRNRWTFLYTGLPNLMGWRRFLWTYGVDFQDRLHDVGHIYLGNDQAENLIKKYNIKYIVIGNIEEIDFEVNHEFFQNKYPVVINNGIDKVYKTQ